jgi:predicted nucleotidyltransferase
MFYVQFRYPLGEVIQQRNDSFYDELSVVFRKSPRLERVILFGSRAMGTHREQSDIDLAIVGNDLTFNDPLMLHVHLDDLGYPYTFDVLILSRIQNEALLDHISRVGVDIYPRA